MRRRVKRFMDLLVALPAVVLLAPLMVQAIAAAIRLQLGKPVMFRQLRPGKDGRPFTLLKFRTMTAACDARGNSAGWAANHPPGRLPALGEPGTNFRNSGTWCGAT